MLEELRAIADLVVEQKLLSLLVLAAFVAFIYYLEPSPPRQIRIAGYRNFVEVIGLKEYFAKEGFEVTPVSSAGSVQSAELLVAEYSQVDFAFVQGGALDTKLSSKLESLGSVGYEPVWVFYKKSLGKTLSSLSELAGLRVGIGPEKGGTRPLVKSLFLLHGIDIEGDPHFKMASYDNNREELSRGDLDALIIVTPFIDHIVQQLLRDPHLELFNFELASAYVKKIGPVEQVILPQASVDIEKMIPPKDIKLIATTTSLVVRKDVNKDLQFLMLVAIKNLNRNPDLLFFSGKREFPAYLDASIPPSATALKFYDFGVPDVMRYLPHSIAGFVGRFWVFLLALASVIYALPKFNVGLRVLRHRARHRAAFEKLLALERKINDIPQDPQMCRVMLEDIDVLDAAILRSKIPTGSEAEYFRYALASDWLRSKIQNHLRTLTATTT